MKLNKFEKDILKRLDKNIFMVYKDEVFDCLNFIDNNGIMCGYISCDVFKKPIFSTLKYRTHYVVKFLIKG
jgi:hypothetical protein